MNRIMTGRIQSTRRYRYYRGGKSDTPREAGCLMSWAPQRRSPYWLVQNCPAPSAPSCSRMYMRTCSSSNPTVDTA